MLVCCELHVNVQHNYLEEGRNGGSISDLYDQPRIGLAEPLFPALSNSCSNTVIVPLAIELILYFSPALEALTNSGVFFVSN